MATSSITDEFSIRDASRLEFFKEELGKTSIRTKEDEIPSLKKGRGKLATFVFR